MPIQIAGIPLHPLLVHAPIVLVPSLVLLGTLYVLIPPLRRHVGWVVFLLTILAPASVFLARMSGEKFRTAEVFADAATQINKHEGYSTVLFWLLVALAPIAWLFGALERGRRTARARRAEAPARLPAADGDEDSAPTRSLSSGDEDPASKGRTIVMIVLGLVMLGLIGVSAYYVYKTGDSGARMAWEDIPLD